MEPKSSRPFIILALVVAALGEVWWAFANDFQMSWMYEFSHYADIARSLTEGRFNSSFLYPSELAVFEKSDYAKPPWPVTYRFPLFALWIAAFFFVFGVSDGVMVAAMAAAWALFVVFTYLMAGRLGASEKVALGTAGILLATPICFRLFALWGYACFLFGALLVVHNTLLVEDGTNKQKAAVGVLGGFCYLARFNFAVFLPLFVLYLAVTKKVKQILPYLGGFFLVALGYRILRPSVAAELQRTAILSGNLCQIDDIIPWLEYQPPADIFAFMYANAGRMTEKLFFNFIQQLEWLFKPYNHYLLVPFAAYYLIKTWSSDEDVRMKHWTAIYAGCSVIQILVFSFLRVEGFGRYWVWAAPCFVLLAALGLKTALESLQPLARKVTIGLLVILGLIWFGGQIRYTTVAGVIPAWWQAPPSRVEFPQVAQEVPVNGLVVTNVAPHTAWYARRPAVDLPNTIEDVNRMIENHDVKAVLIVNWPQGELYNRTFWRNYTKQADWPEKLQPLIGAKRLKVLRGGVLFLME